LRKVINLFRGAAWIKRCRKKVNYICIALITGCRQPLPFQHNGNHLTSPQLMLAKFIAELNFFPGQHAGQGSAPPD
jgi:hypothetical protein